MRLKISPFLLSLALLVGLLMMLPMTLQAGSDSSWTALLSLMPGLGLGLIIATYSAEEQALARALVFIPSCGLVTTAMALTGWVVVGLFGEDVHTVGSVYLLTSVLGAYALATLLRYVYQIKLDSAYAHHLALSSVLSVAPLLFAPLSPQTHGISAGLWVGMLGVYMAWRSGRKRVGAGRRVRPRNRTA